MRASGRAVALTAVTAVFASGATYLVNPDGTGASPTIQAVIDASVFDDDVELADGIFTGDARRGVGFRGKAITVRSLSGSAEACVSACELSDRAWGVYVDEGQASTPRKCEWDIEGA